MRRGSPFSKTRRAGSSAATAREYASSSARRLRSSTASRENDVTAEPASTVPTKRVSRNGLEDAPTQHGEVLLSGGTRCLSLQQRPLARPLCAHRCAVRRWKTTGTAVAAATGHEAVGRRGSDVVVDDAR